MTQYFGRLTDAISCVGVICPWAIRETALGEDNYEILEVLGRGYKSTVNHARHRDSGKPVALKAYIKDKMDEAELRQIEREIQIHSGLSHHNSLAMYAAFEDDTCIFIVLEHCSQGDLFALKRKWGNKLDERTAVTLVMQPMMAVLHFIHKEGIIHRDIKPENVLFDHSMTLKLADFGLCIDTQEERPVTRLGTLDYMAPEVLRCPRQGEEDYEKTLALYNAKVDCWAMGVLAYELLCGSAPFSDKAETKAVHNILYGKIKFPAFLSEDAVDFICTALDRNPNSRPEMRELMRHPWIARYIHKNGTVNDNTRDVRFFRQQLPTATIAAERAAGRRNLPEYSVSATPMSAVMAGSANTSNSSKSSSPRSELSSPMSGAGKGSHSFLTPFVLKFFFRTLLHAKETKSPINRLLLARIENRSPSAKCVKGAQSSNLTYAASLSHMAQSLPPSVTHSPNPSKATKPIQVPKSAPLQDNFLEKTSSMPAQPPPLLLRSASMRGSGTNSPILVQKRSVGGTNLSRMSASNHHGQQGAQVYDSPHAASSAALGQSPPIAKATRLGDQRSGSVSFAPCRSHNSMHMDHASYGGRREASVPGESNPSPTPTLEPRRIRASDPAHNAHPKALDDAVDVGLPVATLHGHGQGNKVSPTPSSMSSMSSLSRTITFGGQVAWADASEIAFVQDSAKPQGRGTATLDGRGSKTLRHEGSLHTVSSHGSASNLSQPHVCASKTFPGAYGAGPKVPFHLTSDSANRSDSPGNAARLQVKIANAGQSDASLPRIPTLTGPARSEASFPSVASVFRRMFTKRGNTLF